MIRSTLQGFEANDEVLNEMLRSIDRFKMLTIEGFVIGLLKYGTVDRIAMEKLLRHAAPYPITFHKAIDQSSKVMEDIAWMNDFSGIDTILTSGGAVKAEDGIAHILMLKSIFNGKIMAGGAIEPVHFPSLHDKLQLEWYHGRSIVGRLGK